MFDLMDTLEQRGAAQERVVEALAHLPRERAMHAIMSFIPLDRLEEVAKFQEER